MTYAQVKCCRGLFQQLVEVEFLFLKRCRLTVEHGHLQHFLHQETQAARLVANDGAQVLHHRGTLVDALVAQHLGCQRDAADRSLQLVRHIVDEVVLNLRISFLTEDDDDGEDKGDEQHYCEYHCWNHETDVGVDVLVHTGEVNLQDTPLGSRVIQEQCL